ncbi:hypothetical protein ACFVAV_09845 [Nocardia sp. NPDC057663]|uniref:hypothetical protein n=1 Tax=Nocardia sp. NPDC057663 TaxID=3346201 RepID=UPI00366EED7D
MTELDHPLAALWDRVRAEHFEGAWSVSDDGWPGRLSLHRTGADSFEGAFVSDRFRQTHHVTGAVGTAPHMLEFVIHDYNFLPEQRYSTFLFTRGRNAFAGSSKWRGIPFGFVAWRRDAPLSGEFRRGTAEPIDFCGTWGMRLNGHSADLVLEYDAGTGLLRGACWGRSLGPSYDVVGRPDIEVPHQVSMTLSRPTSETEVYLDGLLFSRPKNIVCGSARLTGGHVGFYMVRNR